MEVENLVKQAQQGSEDAFSILIKGSRSEVFNLLRKMCGRDDLAQDLYQETMVSAFNGIVHLKNPSSFRWWLKKLARNTFIDYTRSYRKEAQILSWTEEGVELQKHGSVSAEGTLRVKQALDGMESDSHDILLLIDVQGYSYAEAAELMGISEDAVRSRLHRARQNFKDSYAA